LTTIDAAAAAALVESGQNVVVDLADGSVELSPDEVELRVKGQSGFAVSRDGGEVVALDLAIDDELRRRGVARDVIRRVQDLRKDTGLDVSDRIRLWVTGLSDLEPMYELIGREVLAVEVQAVEELAGPGRGAGTPLELPGPWADAQAWIEKV